MQSRTCTGRKQNLVRDALVAVDLQARDVQHRALQESVFIVAGEPLHADRGGTRERRICFTSKPPDLGAVAARELPPAS
jgi:hypothetical protein